MKSYPQIDTARLRLRGFKSIDAPEVQRLAGAYEIAEMTLNVPHPYLDGMAETWIDSHAKDFEMGRQVVFAMIENRSEKLVGAVGLTLTKMFKRAELGYWVGNPFWGKGYATEASEAVIHYGFTELKLNKIHATHFTRNPASGKVMQKLGMESEGVFKQHAIKWDEYVDLAAYGLLAKTWRKNHST